MKRIVFFITHKTLGYEHAEATIQSIAAQEVKSDDVFDILYVYNTHQDELDNRLLSELIERLGAARFFKEIKIFNYDHNSHKSLGADVYNITSYMQQNYRSDDRFLLLKSDCVLSKNYFNDVFQLPTDRNVYFVAPWVCAKERISDEEIIEYSKRDKFVPSDDITFFVEDQTNSSNNDFKNRPDTKVTDQSIKFTSCQVITDYSCHYLSVNLISKIIIEFQSWGGVKFYNLIPYYIGTYNSFVIHKFHSIISNNRTQDREGPVAEWLNS